MATTGKEPFTIAAVFAAVFRLGCSSKEAAGLDRRDFIFALLLLFPMRLAAREVVNLQAGGNQWPSEYRTGGQRQQIPRFHPSRKFKLTGPPRDSRCRELTLNLVKSKEETGSIRRKRDRKPARRKSKTQTPFRLISWQVTQRKIGEWLSPGQAGLSAALRSPSE